MESKYLGTGYCMYCEKEIDVYLVDWGIGAYEYWGARGFHHDWRPCCSQCGGEMDVYDADDSGWYYSHDSKYDNDPRV